MKAVKGLQAQPARRGLPAPKGQLVRKVLRARRDRPARKEARDSKDLRAHKALKVKRARLAPKDRRARRVSPDRQALCATWKDQETRSRAMMVKCLFLPFARQVLLPFKKPRGPNAVRQLASLGSASGSSRRRVARQGNGVDVDLDVRRHKDRFVAHLICCFRNERRAPTRLA